MDEEPRRIAGYSVRMTAQLLQANKAEAEILLRLGSIANALLTVGRRIPDPPYSRRTDRQDAFHLTMLAAAHIYVAIKQLEKRHDGLWWRLAARGQAERKLPVDLQTLRALLTIDSPFAETCARIRDKYIFHVDADPFQEYVAAATDEVTIFSLSGPAIEDVLLPASYEALLVAVPELKSPEFVDNITTVMHAFPYMVEAIAVAFGKEKGFLRVHTSDEP